MKNFVNRKNRAGIVAFEYLFVMTILAISLVCVGR
jgi:hypothetical protein